jgi:hypothetical protein
LYVPRTQGGRDLMQLEEAYEVEITKLVEYVDRKKDPLTKIVRTHQHSFNSAMLQTARRLKTENREEQDKYGQHSRENKRKMAREGNAWTIAK